MESLKNINMDGLKELREKGLKRLKIGGLKNLMVKREESRTECINAAELEGLEKKREEIKEEIKKLNQEKKGIDNHIHLIHKTRKEKYEEVTEFPWREEIFPPLPRKKYVKMTDALEVKDSSLYEEKSEFSEVKDSEIKMKVKEINEKSEDRVLDEKVPEEIASTTVQNIVTINSGEVTDQKNKTEKIDDEKIFSEKEEKTKTVYPFSVEKLKENKTPNKGSTNNSIEKKKSESKNNPAAGLLGENLIEELLSSDDLNPEEEQSFMRYLQEPEIGELIGELKDVKSLLSREKCAG